MADPPPDTDVAGAPRWVKVSGALFIILALLFVVLHLTGNGFRGHTLHTNARSDGGQKQ